MNTWIDETWDRMIPMESNRWPNSLKNKLCWPFPYFDGTVTNTVTIEAFNLCMER